MHYGEVSMTMTFVLTFCLMSTICQALHLLMLTLLGPAYLSVSKDQTPPKYLGVRWGLGPIFLLDMTCGGMNYQIQK